MNRSGDQAATSRSNGSASTWSTPAAASRSARASSDVEHDRRVLGPQHRHRVRVEGHRDQRQPAFVGDLAGPIDDPLVAAVDAVEVADDDDGAAEVGRHRVEGSPDLHDEQPTERRSDEHRDGPGHPVAGLVERQELAVGGEDAP